MSLRKWWWDGYAPYCTASKTAESLKAISETAEQSRVDSFVWMLSSCLHENRFFSFRFYPGYSALEKSKHKQCNSALGDASHGGLYFMLLSESRVWILPLPIARGLKFIIKKMHSVVTSLQFPLPFWGLRDKNRPGTYQSMLFQGYFPFLQYFSCLFMCTQGPKLGSTSPRKKRSEKWIHKNFSLMLFCSCNVDLHWQVGIQKESVQCLPISGTERPCMRAGWP